MPPQHKARKQREEGVSGPSTEVPLATCKPGWRKQENAAEAWDTPYNERYKKIWEAFWQARQDSPVAYPVSLLGSWISDEGLL